MGAHFIPPEPATIADVRDAMDALLADAARARYMRRQLEAAVDHGTALLDALDLSQLDALDVAIATLDEVDGDTDIEDGGDREPSLGAPENHPVRYHKDMEGREHFSRGRRQLGSQTDWAAGGLDDLEDTFADLEPEAGYDLPEGDDERCASSDVDQEHSCGWTAKVNQVHLGHAQEEHEDTAIERHGRGFVRSGPDDSEDSDPAEDDGTGEPINGAWENNRDQSRWCDMVTSPAIYSMRCEGDCCEPVIPDGSRVIVDSEAAFRPGDFVVVHHDDPAAEGGIGSKVKQLVHDLPWSVFPVVADAEILPVISVQTLNPPQGIWYDARFVHAVHKVVKIERPMAGAGSHA